MSANERSGWRDEDLSRRHRLWGMDCPAIDLDFVLVEFHHCSPIALVEYKHERARPQDKFAPGIRALRNLADMAGVPAFMVRYKTDLTQFIVWPLNEAAHVFIPDGVKMSELQYVELLYLMRKIDLPNKIRERLHA